MKKEKTIKSEPRNWTKGELADPETLTPHPDNPNYHPAAQIEALCEVIRENGWRACVVVSNRSGYIIKGHGRLLAAKALGCRVPVEHQDYPDEAAEIRDLVADNKIAELSILSKDKIAELRARFKEAAAGWGDATTDGSLLAKQFGKIEQAKPKEAKFPILILESQEEYDLFNALKRRTGKTSDGEVFREILAAAAHVMGLAGKEERHD